MGENSIQTPEERIQSIHDVEKSVKISPALRYCTGN